MQKRIIVGMVLLSALVLGGCGHHNEHASTSTQPSSKVHKKDTSSKSSSKESSSSSKQATATNNQSAKKGDEPTKFIFPSRMQGNWYSYQKDENDDYQLATMSITGNIWKTHQTDGTVETTPTFSNESDADLDAAQGNGKMNQSRMHWGSAGYMEKELNDRIFSSSENAVGIINIRGWYQANGDGTYLYLTTENIDGKQVDVLTEASGAGLWIDGHFFRTKDQANKYKDEKFHSDSRDDE